MMKKLIWITQAVALSSAAFAQLPDTEIYMVDMKVDKGVYTFGKPVNVTKHVGYDNQPAFDPKGQFLYYSSMQDKNQTDIMMLPVDGTTALRLTNTPESEYSPTPMRGTDYISCVRVEKDSSQHVFRYTKMGKYPVDLTPKNDSVGYHSWLGDYHIALFILDSIKTLQLVEVRSQTYDTIALNPGRCLHTISYVPELLFTQMNTDSIWQIKKYVLKTKEITDLALLPKGVEDFGLTRDGKLMCAQNGKLMMLNPFYGETKWKQVADFSAEVKQFYRIAVSPRNDKIAIVAHTPKEAEKK